MGKKITVQHEGQTVEAIELEFEAEKEPWSVYRMEDGAVVKIKQSVAKAYRLEGVFKPDGQPIYLFHVAGTTHVDAPAELCQKVGQ